MPPADQTSAATPSRLRRVMIVVVWFCLIFVVTDLVYKSVFNITYQTREKCLIYSLLPKPLFLVFEYTVEFGSLVVAGVFLALILERYFNRYAGFFPRGPLTAFLYGSLLPLCACSTIPLIQAMRAKLKFRTIITFIVAAPMLSPIIIMLAFTVIGWKYALLRIAAAFVVAVSSGFVLEAFRSRGLANEGDLFGGCKAKYCARGGGDDLYIGTYAIMRGILPYLAIAAVMGIVFDIYVPKDLLESYDLSGNGLTLILVTAVGVPLYFCSGAEIIAVRPLMDFWHMPMGTAVAFSLTSTALCVTTFFMLWRFLGPKLTIILSLYIFAVSAGMGFLINLAMP